MDANKLVSALVESVHGPSVEDVLTTLNRPSGRRPSHRIVQLAEWYRSLSALDQARLRDVVEQTVHTTLFGLLCVLDGVRAIESTDDKSELELFAARDGSRHRPNSPDAEPLHDIYQSLVYEQVFGEKA